MQHLKLPVGWLVIREEHGKLVGIDFLNHQNSTTPAVTALERQAESQLKDYFQNKSRVFNLPLEPLGTEYQLRVWRALQKIPYGQTKTYAQLAAELHSSPRAIGNACRANPIPIIIPCHRVVAKTGIGGYGGKTNGPVLERKRWLLAHEGIVL